MLVCAIMNIHRTTSAITIRSRKWQPLFDSGRNARAKIGFVLIPNEQTIEDDMIKHVPPGVGCYFHRGKMPHEISTAALAAMGDIMEGCAAAIMPDDGLDVICYACTSGTVAVGEQKTLDLLTKGARGAKPTTLMTAVTEALSAIGAKRLAVATPYVDELNSNIANHLLSKGFELAAFEGLNLDYDRDMIRVTPDYLCEFASSIDTPDADAVLISCGALRAIDIVDRLERDLGKPVICSNQAMLWHVLRLAGIKDKLPNLGTLLRKH
jgi:maleate isomerase